MEFIPAANLVHEKGNLDNEWSFGQLHSQSAPKDPPPPHQPNKSLLDVHAYRRLVEFVGVLALVPQPAARPWSCEQLRIAVRSFSGDLQAISDTLQDVWVCPSLKRLPQSLKAKAVSS